VLLCHPSKCTTVLHCGLTTVKINDRKPILWNVENGFVNSLSAQLAVITAEVVPRCCCLGVLYRSSLVIKSRLFTRTYSPLISWSAHKLNGSEGY
jgi:hypothetical protein